MPLSALLFAGLEQICRRSHLPVYVQQANGKEAVLYLVGQTAYLCGESGDGEELFSFLHLHGWETVCTKELSVPLQAAGASLGDLFLRRYWETAAAADYPDSIQEEGASLSIREGTGIEDARKAWQLYRDCGTPIPPFDEYYVNLFTLVRSGAFSYLLLERDGKAVSCVGRQGTLLSGVVVHPSCRGQGLGKLAVCTAAQAILKRGEIPLTLFKEEVRGFYESLPFEGDELLYFLQ